MLSTWYWVTILLFCVVCDAEICCAEFEASCSGVLAKIPLEKFFTNAAALFCLSKFFLLSVLFSEVRHFSTT